MYLGLILWPDPGDDFGTRRHDFPTQKHEPTTLFRRKVTLFSPYAYRSNPKICNLSELEARFQEKSVYLHVLPREKQNQ